MDSADRSLIFLVGSTLYWVFLFTCLHISDFVKRARLIVASSSSSWPLWSTNLEQQQQQLRKEVPQHIAFLLNDKRYTNAKFVHSLIKHSIGANIGCITLCDRWSILKKNCAGDCAKWLHPIKINLLGQNDGKMELVKACKQLASSVDAITSEMVAKLLARPKNGIHSSTSDAAAAPIEPDFLVCVGPELCTDLAGFSPWTLRTTELHSIVGFACAEALEEREFDALLTEFSQRCRRFGR